MRRRVVGSGMPRPSIGRAFYAAWRPSGPCAAVLELGVLDRVQRRGEQRADAPGGDEQVLPLVAGLVA